MEIRKKVRSLDRYLKAFSKQENFFLVFTNLEAQEDLVRRVGFSMPVVTGERLLPAGIHGRAALRNSEGEEIVHRDRQKEIHHRQRQWTWKEFRGRYRSVEQTRIVDVPFERYPRSWKAPYGVELMMQTAPAGGAVITAGPFTKDGVAPDLLLNTVHMFVELFGECSLSGIELKNVSTAPVRRLNWELLPVGSYPWSRAEPAIDRFFKTVSVSDQAVLRERVKAITAYEPNFIAIGKNGFSKYVVYGWEKQQIYVLESTEVNNATYVLKSDWERVSAMTKAEVLDSSSHHARLIHRETWWREVADLMRAEGIRLPSSGA